MTHEDMERAIEFVLGQQAKFASDMQRLAGFGSDLAKAQIRTQNDLADLAEAQTRTQNRLAELAEAQKRTDAKVAELAEAQRATQERLNIFINVVERHLSGNGKGQKPA